MAKILKNTTVSPLGVSDLGITIPANSSYTVQVPDYLLLADSSDVITPITSGDIVVNDGSQDLSTIQGLLYVGYPDDALRLHFLDNSVRSNGFSAQNVQDAIEESRNQVAGKLEDFGFMSSGSVQNKWLNIDHPSVTSDTVPLVTPWSGKITALTFSNKNDNVDIDIELYINTVLAYTWEIRNKRTAWKALAGGIATVSQGDRLSMFARAYNGGTGGSPRDVAGEIMATLITQPDGDGGTQNGV